MDPDDDALRKELFELSASLREGTLDSDGNARLNELLRTSPVARKIYLRERMVDSLLAYRTADDQIESAADTPAIGRRHLLMATAAILSLFFVSGFALVLYSLRPQTPAGAPIGFVEFDGSGSFQEGDPIHAARLKWGDADLQFRLHGGARVLVEGPAQIELLGDDEISLTEGRLRAQLGGASGKITVRTDAYEATDLGTDFGIETTRDGESSIHVLDGRVAVRADDLSAELDIGEGLVWANGAHVGKIKADPDRFSDFHPLEERQARWEREWNTLVQGDPSVLAAFDFEDFEQLTDFSGNGYHGKIENAVPATGRWPGKSALEFSELESLARFDIPGSHEEITISCWLKVDQLNERGQSILMSAPNPPNGVRLLIGRGGYYAFGTRRAAADGLPELRSATPLEPDRLGQWSHAAFTYDASQRQLCLYFDGQRVGEWERAIPGLHLRNAEIGNWNQFNKRPLSGVIDELIIWKRVLSAEEILNLARSGGI